jgi:hypothetical protein
MPAHDLHKSSAKPHFAGEADRAHQRQEPQVKTMTRPTDGTCGCYPQLLAGVHSSRRVIYTRTYSRLAQSAAQHATCPARPALERTSPPLDSKACRQPGLHATPRGCRTRERRRRESRTRRPSRVRSGPQISASALRLTRRHLRRRRAARGSAGSPAGRRGSSTGAARSGAPPRRGGLRPRAGPPSRQGA